MKRLFALFWLIGMVILISCQTQSVGSQEVLIPKENQVILIKESYFEPQYESWIPTQEQVDEALNAISAFLMAAESNNSLDEYFKSEIEKIIDNYDKYRVQFVGIMENEKKYIHCNFILINYNFPINWKEQLIVVEDGGFWYWYVFYDIEFKKVRKIYINGYA
ncbi:MAG: hypothetical protein JW822_08440 [Spirochaetales bacterium]|nr:hypothetical protein [Spirochaetales bacterium]